MKKDRRRLKKVIWAAMLVGGGFLLGLLLMGNTQSTVVLLEDSAFAEQVMMDAEERVRLEIERVEEMEEQFEQQAAEFSAIPPIPEIPPIAEFPEFADGATVHVRVTESGSWLDFGSMFRSLTAVSLILFGVWMVINGRKPTEKTV